MRATGARDFAVALSLANILLMKGWQEMQEGVRHPYFRLDSTRYWTDFLGLTLVVLLATGVFWAAARLARRRGGAALRFGPGVFLLACVYVVLLVASILRRQFPAYAPKALAARFGEVPLIVFVVALLAAAGYLVYRFRPPLARGAASLLLVFLPAVLLTFGKTAWVGWAEARGESPAIEVEAPEEKNARPARRVVWMVFDSLDYRLAIEERPASLTLPNLDRLLGESFSTTHAVSPAPVTRRSMAALILGRMVARALPVGADDLLIWFEREEPPVRWSDQPNIFSRAKEAGYRSAVTGWYHPYCGLLRGSVVRCRWWPHEVTLTDRPVLQAMGEFIRMSVPPWARVDFFAWVGVNVMADSRRSHIDKYLGTLDTGLRDVSDPSLGLVLVHWPVPHVPYIYDRATGELTLTPDPQEGYLDNLALMDRALGQTLGALRQSGTLDRTVIIVTSDHPWGWPDIIDGKRDPRVPFIVRLPGTARSYSYQDKLNTVVTSEMLLEILEGRLVSNDDLVRWLERREGVADD